MSDLEKFKGVIAVPYKDQAIFFLNAFLYSLLPHMLLACGEHHNQQ